jgi:DNA-binding CsgD family transcriptional regulator
MRTGDPWRPQDLGVTIVEIPDPRRGFHTAVHILDLVEEKSWLARELGRAREVAGALPPKKLASPDGSIPIRLQLSPSTMAPAKGLERDGTFAEPLSDREMHVLRAIASGQANKEIASALRISLATTRNHVQHILKKLDVHTKLEAMALAFRNGWTG